MAVHPSVREVWPVIGHLHDALEGLPSEVHVTLGAGAVDHAHVEKIVDRKLAERDRAQDIDERMNWQ